MTDEQLVIAGIGQTAFGKLPGRTDVSLNVEASSHALKDAGIDKTLVDGLFAKLPSSAYQKLYGQLIASALGIEPRWGGAWDEGGASNITLIHMAGLAIAAGHCDVALVTSADTPRTGSRTGFHRPLTTDGDRFGYLGVAAGYALIAQRHKAEYGTTEDQLGAVAVACREHGANNPRAQLRRPITLEDYRSSPLIIDPLRRDDCALVSDAGAAAVVMTAKRARQLGVENAVPVLGFGHGQTPQDVHLRTSLTETAAATAGAKAFEEARITPRDIDVAQIYDCFTITALMTLEDYGFCAKGEGGPFVASGALHLDGEIPMNTSGGLLSETGMPGFQLINEGVRQIRGESANQVSGARTCIVSNQGGNMHSHSTMILGNT